MEEQNKSAITMWENYLLSINETVESTDKEYSAWSFGNSNKMADDLADLVKRKIKTGTSSLHYLYTIDNESLPQLDEYSIILNGSDNAECIIKTISVEVIPFNQVSEEFANKEGEGDKTLAYWRKVHTSFLEESLLEFEKEFTEDMLVVCEEFQVVY